MKSPIADTDLISARKAAMGWNEDAKRYAGKAEYWRKEYETSSRRYPIFLIVGVLIGTIGTLYFAIGVKTFILPLLH